MIFSGHQFGVQKTLAKNRPRHRGPPQFKNMCGHKCSTGVENKCLRRCKTMEKQRHGKTSVAYVQKTIEPLATFRPVTLKFCRQNGPRFGVQKRTPKWRPLIQSQFDLLVSGRLGPRFGVQKTDPKAGAVCRQNFCRRAKIVQVSIVSAGTRQKFCIPLGHWVPMVLQRREQLFSTPCERLCPHLFLNWGGPLWRPWNPLRFWRLVLGPSMDKIFPRVVIRLAASHCS